MNENKGLRLIEDLKSDPEKFYNDGKKQWDLIGEYYKGFSKDTLRELFYIENKWLKRVIIFITSELGRDCSDLLKEVLTQLDDDDHYVCCHALEIITFHGENIDDRMRVFSFLEHSNQRVRLYAMHLMSVFRGSRIHEALVYLANKENYSDSHKKGLLFLLDVYDFRRSELKEITKMIDSDDAIIRKYGVIAADKLFTNYPHIKSSLLMSYEPIRKIINEAVDNEDLDVREYAKLCIKSKIEYDQMMHEIGTDAE